MMPCARALRPSSRPASTSWFERGLVCFLYRYQWSPPPTKVAEDDSHKHELERPGAFWTIKVWGERSFFYC
jgi:hypothetical protein